MTRNDRQIEQRIKQQQQLRAALARIGQQAAQRQRQMQRRRRAEEQIVIDHHTALMQSARDRIRQGQRGGLSRSLASWHQRRVIEQDPDLARCVDPDVWRYDSHIRLLAASLHVHVTYDAAPASNAYACRSWIDVQPIRSVQAYVIALHELGHTQQRCAGSSHRRIRIGPHHVVCVVCEVDAWNWARRTAITWNAAAQDTMTASLNSYAFFARTPAERQAIAALTSRREWYAERQRRLAL